MNISKNKPLFSVISTAPVRICDNGGWTDTWFARHGKIFNIGVQPLVEVQIAVYHQGDLACPSSGSILKDQCIVINVENYGEKYLLGDRRTRSPNLLETVVEYIGLPVGQDYEITVFSPIPPGAATGTSASVTVALLGGLYRLKQLFFSPKEIATIAHQIETEVLKHQSGVQDQLCSAYGGINFIEMKSYPKANLHSLRPSDEFRWELERRLVLIYLGTSHSSSEVHTMVIDSLKDSGSDCRPLNQLRLAAEKSRQAIVEENFKALGQAMIDNTWAQYELHPRLISEDAKKVFDIAREFEALGWKVNGAGGDGGSLTILCGHSSSQKREMIRTIENEIQASVNIPIILSDYGLRTWQVV